jgi:hypothetical protein
VDVFFASGTVRHKKDSGCIFGRWDSEAQKGGWMYFLAGGTVRHKKESGCIFGWWNSEAQKGGWMNFWLVGQ